MIFFYILGPLFGHSFSLPDKMSLQTFYKLIPLKPEKTLREVFRELKTKTGKSINKLREEFQNFATHFEHFLVLGNKEMGNMPRSNINYVYDIEYWSWVMGMFVQVCIVRSNLNILNIIWKTKNILKLQTFIWFKNLTHFYISNISGRSPGLQIVNPESYQKWSCFLQIYTSIYLQHSIISRLRIRHFINSFDFFIVLG